MGTDHEEIKPLSYDLPYVVDITLYKHNYYDNLIISQLKKHAQYDTLDDDDNTFIVTSYDFENILSRYFKRELFNAQSLTEVTIKDGANSIYFIDKILNNFPNLEYIKVNISRNREYSRLLQVGEQRQVISFDYRIVTAVMDLTKYIEHDDELRCMNSFLKEIGIIETDVFNTGKAYYRISTQDFMLMIGTIEEQFMNDITFESTYMNSLNLLYDLIDQKAESDNAQLIIITDYPD